MMNTIEMFSGLGDVKIEGIEVIAVKYKNICEQAKKKNYDILDHRKAEVKSEILIIKWSFQDNIGIINFIS